MADRKLAESLRDKLRKHSAEEENKPPKKSVFNKFKAKRKSLPGTPVNQIPEVTRAPFDPDDEESNIKEVTKEEVAEIAATERVLTSEEEKFVETVVNPALVTTTTVNVHRMYKDGRIVTKNEEKEDLIKIRTPHPSAPMVHVGWKSSMTINMGDYNSTIIGIEVNLPCYMEELGEALDAAKRIVELRVNREVEELRDFREKKGS